MSTVDTKNSYKYSVYGLTLGVNRSLPGLPPVDPNTEVDVVVDFFGEEATELDRSANSFQSGLKLVSQDNTRFYHFWFKGYGQINFNVSFCGTNISANWTGSNLAEVTTLLLGQIMGSTLRLRGHLCLHACVIKIGDRAVAIIGESGAGKSTMAAALASRGNAILADDVAAFQEENGRFSIQPGYPRLRLWPKSIQALYGSEAGLNRIFNSSEKRFIVLDNEEKESAWKFCDRPLPVAAIYVLGKRQSELSAPSIEVIPPVMATMNLMTHRSVSHLQLDGDRQAQEFAGFGRIAAKVTVRKIVRSDDLTALPQICQLIEQDVASLEMRDRCPQS